MLGWVVVLEEGGSRVDGIRGVPQGGVGDSNVSSNMTQFCVCVGL